MTASFYFRCKGCGEPRFLILNYCATCEPSRHRAHAAHLERFVAAETKFKEATGTDPLDDWQAFEDFCAREGLS